MAQPGETLTNPVTGQRLTFRRTTAETGGELVEVESELPAGGPKPPAHYHPRQEEHFEVLSGRVDVRLGKERRTLGTGETLDVPPGAVHEMSAAGDEPARLLWQTRPALRTEQFFEAARPLGNPGPLTGASLVNRFSDEIRLPGPWPVLRPLVAALAGLARLTGRGLDAKE
jgi:quercetin dioxygenase-like cupin family protein